MTFGRTLFSQIMDFVPWTSFDRIVSRYGGDIRVRSLRCSRSGLSDAQLRQAGADAGRLWKWYHLNEGLNGMAEPVAPLEAPLHLLSQARDLYLRLHEKGTDGTHVQRTNNLIAKVIAACGDKDLTKYTRADARKFSEALAAEGLKTTTIRNYLSMVIAIINRGTQEWQITMTNPFSGIDLKHEARTPKRLSPSAKTNWRLS